MGPRFRCVSRPMFFVDAVLLGSVRPLKAFPSLASSGTPSPASRRCSKVRFTGSSLAVCFSLMLPLCKWAVFRPRNGSFLRSLPDVKPKYAASARKENSTLHSKKENSTLMRHGTSMPDNISCSTAWPLSVSAEKHLSPDFLQIPSPLSVRLEKIFLSSPGKL
jgi:hypothetical protein